MSKLLDDLELRDSEADRVFAWRYQLLLHAGCSDLEATAVAASGFDLHRARKMLKNGCSCEQLAEIAS